MVASVAVPRTSTISAPALAATSTSVRPASMIFMSATMTLSGKEAFQFPHRIEAFTLDQRRAGLDPIHPGGHGQLGDVDGPVQIHEVQR